MRALAHRRRLAPFVVGSSALAVVLAVSAPQIAGAAKSAGAGVECPAPSLTVTNPTPTSSPTAWILSPPTKVNLPGPHQAADVKLRRALNASLKYNLVRWVHTCFGHQSGLIEPNGTGEFPVRTEAMAAYAAAVALTTRGYDASAVGLSAATATDIARRLAVGVAMSHAVNANGVGWGHNSQSAYWAFLAGTGGWLLFPAMTDPERQAIARMVADEADYRVSKPNPIGYYANRAGAVLSPGNTKSDTDAWNASVLGLAAVMLPHDPRVAGWRHMEAQLQMAAFSRPADLANHARVNGRTVSSWLNGTNIFNDGTLVNHGRLNPQYMSAFHITLNGLLSAGITGQAGLRTGLWNSGLVYKALSRKSFASPPWATPGGTIYRANSGEIYYPEDNDWGTVEISSYVAFDALAANLGFGQPYGARGWLGRHVTRQLQLQARFTDGRTFAGRSSDNQPEFTYRGREQVTANDLAQAWLADYLGFNKLLTATDGAV